ncbi:MAG: NAD(P)/FAD-dependent oxidoreductase [Mariprofundaceae bacterium]
MESCDVLIVGGGPAGSTCAWRLKQAGLDVCVLDKSRFPRDKICAGWVTPQVLQSLHIEPEEYAKDRILQPISAFRTGVIGAPTLETFYDEPVSYGIRRCEFDHYLLERSGARLYPGESAEDMKRTDEGWIVNGHFQTRLLIGAGGHFCPVARQFGGTLRNEPVIAAQEIEFEMSAAQRKSCPVRGEMPELYFCPDMQGYGWCFRKGNFLNVGLGRRDSHKLSAHVEGFCAWLQKTGRIPWEIALPFRGHAYLVYGQARRKRLDDGMLLIGDAAGLAYEESGEGIRPAIESGLLAAQAVSNCNGTYSTAGLSRYEELLEARFGQSSFIDLSGLFPSVLTQAVARRLFVSHWFTKRVLIERFFLRRHQTPL